jgi:sarcosine oxidase
MRPTAAQHRDYIVVGAGLLGLAAGRALTSRGRDVLVLEQAAVGHDGAGSKGSCRIFRLGYPDPVYVQAARRAGELWRQLEQESGQQILISTPQLSFGAGLAGVQDAMEQAGAPCQPLSEQDAAERFPGVRTGGPALLEPDSCVTAADTALAALAAAIPDLRTGVRVTGLADDGRQVTVSTSDGDLTARGVLVCAGPSSRALLAGLPGWPTVPTTATLEQVGYLRPAADAPANMPIFICHGGDESYGLPVPGSDRYKLGVHHGGPPVDPDSQDQAPDAALVGEITAVAARSLPGCDPVPVSAERCVYDNSTDQDFVLDHIGNVSVACGTSGHGFKFGPLFGEWLAWLATGDGADRPPERFALARLG